ncbi:MAG: glucose 1-dehydrogenase [Chloroflexota bacterium]
MMPQQMLDFTDCTVVVTGAGGGIGAGIALRFAEAGANLVVNYRRSADGAEAVVTQIQSFGRQAVPVQADVTQKADVERLFEQTIAAFGGVNVLVNNAGIYPLHGLADMPVDDWDAVINANLRSTFLCTQAAAQIMKVSAQPMKSVINIASIEAENPAPMHTHYNAAKAAVVMFTRSAAGELGADGIRVNAVSPGLIWREGIEEAWPDGVERYKMAAPLGRLGTAEDVANACLFLASPGAGWITGANLVVDGGVMTNQIF